MNMVLILAAVYGTLTGGELVKAPPTVNIGAVNCVTSFISEPQANALGYKLVVDEPPTCASNEFAVAAGWAEDTRIRRVYNKMLRPIEKPRYSVADLFYWVKTKGKEQIVDKALDDAGFYTVAVTTVEVEAGNETFAAVLAAVKESGIFTDEEITEALEYAKLN